MKKMILDDLFAQGVDEGVLTSTRDIFMTGALMALSEIKNNPENIDHMLCEIHDYSLVRVKEIEEMRNKK